MNHNYLAKITTSIAALLVLAALAGCTTGKHNAAGQQDSGANESSTLRCALVVEPSTLDPAKVQDQVTAEMLIQIFEGLTRFNEKNELEPALAEKWDVSPDGKIYTFHIRPGVKFHNGREVTAADVKYSWERAINPKTQSTVSANYLDGVIGLQDVVKGKRADLQGVEVIDPHTLKVTLDRARAFFVSMLTYPTDFVVCKEAIEKSGGIIDNTSMIGTGPFALESYTPGQILTMKSNEGYWGGRPKLARIEWPVIVDPETAYSNFETGKIDQLIGVPVARFAQDRDSGKFKEEYKITPGASVDYIAMLPSKEPAFAKKQVRQAFLYAIDRDKIMKVANKNVGTVADGLIPPELLAGENQPPHTPYDPAKAKALLAQAGYPNGDGFPKLALFTIEKTPRRKDTCLIIRDNLKNNLGINVSFQTEEAGQYWNDTAHENLAFYLSGWSADYPDAQDFISTLFMSKASLNHYNYNSPQLDKLCEQGDIEQNVKTRASLYAQANRILADDVGVIPIDYTPRVVLTHTNVKGWRTNLCGLLPHLLTTK